MINIVIPTYKRACALVGEDYFRFSKYVLPESQRDDYKKMLPAKRMIVIPDENDGNIARKRNWILRNIGRPLLMLDDDVCGLTTTEGIYTGGEFQKAKQMVKLTPDQATNVIECGFNLANEFGCVLWGVNVNTDGRNYQQYKPFSLSHVILGPFSGHLKHDLFYDERMGTKDDYDFSLQVLRKYKKILRINKYSYDCSHGTNSGGLVGGRTLELEAKYCQAIMKKWGAGIIKYTLPPKKPTDLLNAARVNIPIAGV